jgi:hypothetical protein
MRRPSLLLKDLETFTLKFDVCSTTRGTTGCLRRIGCEEKAGLGYKKYRQRAALFLVRPDSA